MMLKRKFW